MREKTVAAISTPLGQGGLGVIRLSGPEATLIADQVFHPVGKTPLREKKGYTAAFGRLVDSEGEIDEAVALVFRAPRSYTGEDVVELSCHGGPYLLRRTLRALCQAGAVPAGKGEFTKRAFLNGKLSLTQAEAVMDLISSEGSQASKAALSLKDGALYRKLSAVTGELTRLCATLSAWVDYPDDEIPEITEEELGGSLAWAKEELEKLVGDYGAGQLIRDGADTCIVGRPNVGKSTLMNLLSGTERSIVTEIPGTTRDLVENRVTAGGVVLNLTDTAGLRDTEDPVERIGVARARERMDRADLVLAVFDCSVPLEEEDASLLSSLKERPAVILANKSDLPGVFDPLNALCGYGAPVIPVSAKTGEGKEALVEAIGQVLRLSKLDLSGGILANERQLSCAKDALGQVSQALEALTEGMTFDAVDVMISSAIDSLLSLTGERAGEQVINEIFSRFCVGK